MTDRQQAECQPASADSLRQRGRILQPRVAYENGGYRSPEASVGFLRRAFPTAGLYPSFLRNVWRSSALARKGIYGYDDWVESSVDVLRSLERVGVRVEVSGVEHLQNLQGGGVIIGNHMSTLETMVLPAMIGSVRRVTFILKDSLFHTPIFRDIVETIDAIGVSRTNPRADLKIVLDGGSERLNKGTSIVVFPQTTRSMQFNATQFSKIGVKLAQRAQAPIIPLALCSDAWANGKWIKDFGRIDPTRTVRFVFGAPFHVEGRGNDEHQRVIDFIENQLKSWEIG